MIVKGLFIIHQIIITHIIYNTYLSDYWEYIHWILPSLLQTFFLKICFLLCSQNMMLYLVMVGSCTWVNIEIIMNSKNNMVNSNLYEWEESCIITRDCVLHPEKQIVTSSSSRVLRREVIISRMRLCWQVTYQQSRG